MNSDRLFENTEIAFSLKSDSEIERAYFLFKMIANQPLVRIGTAVTNFALKANLPVQGLIRATVFDHFCGGIHETDCLPVVDKMYAKGVSSVLDYSVEGKESENQFDAALHKVISLIAFASTKSAMPFAVFKPTAFGRLALWQKKSNNEEFTPSESAEWQRVIDRFETVCQSAQTHRLALLIDAEESWMQDAADDLVNRMMRKYNKNRVVVYNTLQMYRHDRYNYLLQLHEEARVFGYKIGIKLVRGAYLEREKERAKLLDYPSPLCASKTQTDQNFDKSLRYILSHLHDIGLFIGTHNETSTYLALDLMQQFQIKCADPRVWFGQLYGMSDHISYNLAESTYRVVKYLPFGPIKDVMPYLIRRAEENTSVSGQSTRELKLLTIEKDRRGI